MQGVRILRIELQGLPGLAFRAFVVVRFQEFPGRPDVGEIVDELLSDLPDRGGAGVDELRDVGGPVGRGQMVQDHGGRALALLVDVSQVESRVRRVRLAREDQPLAVGREAVPGVHPLGVGAQSSGLAALGGNDVQLAVRLEEHVVLCPAEHDPLAVGRVLREEVALAVEGGPRQRLRLAPLPVVERDPVEVELEGLALLEEFAAVLGTQEHLRSLAGASAELYASVAAKTMDLPSGLHVALLCTRFGSSAPGSD